jgi:hypothetical protein
MEKAPKAQSMARHKARIHHAENQSICKTDDETREVSPGNER